MSGNKNVATPDQSEHIGDDTTGDNIQAKRVANYYWDGANWQRVGVTQAIAGNKTNNNTAPGATNVGVLPAVANAAAPLNTEGNQVALSTDLAGNTRVVAVGNVAAGAVDSGNGVKMSALVNASDRAYSNGQRGDLRLATSGELYVRLRAGNNDLDITRGNQDGNSPNINNAGALTQATLYNGTTINTWDRQRNTTTNTALASAARTATTASADQTNWNYRGIKVILNVTAASGAGGLQLQLQGKDSISATYYNLNTAPTAVTATGIKIYDFYPTAPGTASGDITNVYSALIGRTFRVNVVVGDTSSYTYSVSYEGIL